MYTHDCYSINEDNNSCTSNIMLTKCVILAHSSFVCTYIHYIYCFTECSCKSLQVDHDFS